VLALAADFLQAVGVHAATLELNSVGCPACRPLYREALRAALAATLPEMCGDCQRRFETNPLRLLDCKVPHCRALTQHVPVITDTLCDDCRTHLAGVEHGLQTLGVAYVINPHIVRGLDYYMRTAFEFTQSEGLGAQNTVLAGGRYDGLVKELGGPATPGIGFAAGVERLLLASSASADGVGDPPPVFFAALGDAARALAFRLAADARHAGVTALMDYSARSLKAQMREADRLGADRVVLLGDNEIARGEATVRRMTDSTQQAVPLTGLIAWLAGTPAV
jgi:histidyl-tRNA synthetase